MMMALVSTDECMPVHESPLSGRSTVRLSGRHAQPRLDDRSALMLQEDSESQKPQVWLAGNG